jgi:lipopolysaccharide/colanic/teichoic acid biosynthesis glycosyltransferase
VTATPTAAKEAPLLDVDREPRVEDPFVLPPRYATGGIRAQLAMKRGIDIAGASLGLVALSPALAVIAVLVRLDSKGPIFYPWKVVGVRGRQFTGYKFRTMIPDAEARLGALESRNEMTGPAFKMRDDPRVTGIGRFLRRFSLDELPQLWSVLQGDMSLVGPRPPLRTEWSRFEPWQRRKLSVKPGVTCLWQVSGRSDIKDFTEWVKLDLEYIERWNLLLDFKILFATFSAVVRSKGAY